jgi:dephospho-CoA kinase
MTQKKIIIGVAGEMGAGKGTITTYLMQQYHAQNVRYSAILQDILRRLNIPYTRENLAQLAESLRGAFGAEILSRALIADIMHSDTHVIVVDGIRKEGELAVLRELEGFTFIFVDADMRVRYERITQRNEKVDDAQKTFEEFQRDHERAADRDVPSLKSQAQFVIDNNHDIAQTHAQIDVIMAQLLAQ